MAFVLRKVFCSKALCLVVVLIVLWCELLIYMRHARSCGETWRQMQKNTPDELNVIMISDTHILGKFRGHWFDKLRREWQMSKSFEMSVRYMQPDAVFFLGDLMDEGEWTDENLFNEYADRFFSLFTNETSEVPMYFVPGNHDLGFHYEINPERIKWFKNRFNVDPVELHVIKEHTFVLVNSMALHGDNCTLCFEGTRLIEKYSKVLSCAASSNCSDEEAAPYKPYNRPILLQHFPLFRLDEKVCLRDEDFDETAPDRDEIYREKWECLSQESSNYLLAKFIPRAVFNGHAHRGCKREWSAPVSFFEYTMNSFNWRNNDVPTVLMVTINREEVKTKVCYLPSERNIIACYIFLAVCVLFYLQYLLISGVYQTSSEQSEAMRDSHRDQTPASFAWAIYANSSEYPEELAFEKGDHLRIISEGPGANLTEGWWLCENERGQRGIAPANRLQKMTTQGDGNEPFDRKFFQVASPLMDDFFLFNLSSPFDDPFFRDRAAFTSSFRDRGSNPQPFTEVSSTSYDNSFPKRTQVVRNIPIVVQNGRQPQQTSSNFNILDDVMTCSSPSTALHHSHQPTSHQIPGTLRRTVSSGPVSPQPLKERVIDIQTVPARAPSPPARRHFLSTGNLNIPNIDEPTSSSLADNCYDDYDNHSYSSSDTRRPARTLILPSSVPGRSIEIPLGSSNYDSVPPPLPREHSISKERKPDSSAASQLEKLSQRLKKLAQPFKHSSNHHDDYIKTASMPNLLQKEKRVESPTNSSGIGADIMDTTDSSNSSEEQKRTSDLSSLSDQNSLLSDIAADDTRNSTVNNLKQPYLNRLAREKSPSTSVLQTVLDQIGRENKPKIPILSTFAGSRNSDPLSGILIDEDIYRSTMPKWARPQNEPVVNPLNDSKLYNNSDMESEIQNRKRVICNKMADALKLIENGVEQIKKATAAQRWRGAHILQANLNSLQNAVSTINESLDSFVVSSGRISVENGSPKSAELQRLLAPLLQSRSQIASLRKSLDSTGWTVAALSRGKDHINTMDPLEQFISLSQEIPTACRSLLQWVQLLVPSNTVVFLSPSAIVSNSALTALTSMSQNPAYNTRTEDLKNPNFLKMEERLKGSVPNIHEIKTIPITHALSSIDILSDQIPSVPSMNILPSSLPSSVKSASSSSNSSTSEYATIGPKKQNANPLKDARILEEDDLESVYSDRESLLQDYAYLDDAVAGRTNNSTSPFINEEDRQLVRFYAPQIKQHIDALGDAIEAFLAAVENSLPPREFVQKGKLIILTVHKLIYIGDTISQCVKDKVINENMRTCADRLCELLKQCVRATKIAADEYPDIRCMQTMVDSIINVSKSAHDLKAMANNYC